MPALSLDKLGLERLGLDRLGLDRLSMEGIEEAIFSSPPLLAVLGAGDLAVERVRAARAELAARSQEGATLREQAQAKLMEGIEVLQTEVRAAPEHLKALPERAQEWPTRAQSMAADIVSAAFSAYGELAGRGQAVVTQSGLFGDSADADLADDTMPLTRPGTPPVSFDDDDDDTVEGDADAAVTVDADEMPTTSADPAPGSDLGEPGPLD